MAARTCSPGAFPAPWSAPQPGGPGPAKRRRLENHDGPEPHALGAPPDPADRPAEPAPPMVSAVILGTGSALQLPLEDGSHLLLQPGPDSVLFVTLQEHYLDLACHDPGSGGHDHSLRGLGASPENHVATFAEQQGFYASVPPAVREEELPAQADDLHPGFLAPYADSPAGFAAGLPLWPAAVPSPDNPWGPVLQRQPRPPVCTFASGSPGLLFHQDDFHLPWPLPSSPLQPLPPFPTPWPHGRPARLPGPHRKARRCLFQP